MRPSVRSCTRRTRCTRFGIKASYGRRRCQHKRAREILQLRVRALGAFQQAQLCSRVLRLTLDVCDFEALEARPQHRRVHGDECLRRVHSRESQDRAIAAGVRVKELSHVVNLGEAHASVSESAPAHTRRQRRALAQIQRGLERERAPCTHFPHRALLRTDGLTRALAPSRVPAHLAIDDRPAALDACVFGDLRHGHLLLIDR